MIKIINLLALNFLISIFSIAQGYDIGDEVSAFALQNIDNTTVSLNDYDTEKGVIIIFTCNHCPYSVAYEDRIIALDKKYKELGYPVVAINPNDPELYPSDSFAEMKKRAKDKGFTFPYLFDENQTVFPIFGATKTPHIYLLKNQAGKFIVAYIGAIDNNTNDEKVTESYLSDALDSLIEGNDPAMTKTKAVGCGIKVKK
ncbi:MAG: thioredoxin family protein [Bacteroidales bacterium]|nr:thioredoxin family protein [Bacteroidales bacterium]